jgi:ligand-binding SRPBCC domain-containing protein
MTDSVLARELNTACYAHRPPEQNDMPEFQSSTTLKCSVQTLREFLGQPKNLPDVSEPDLELEIVAAPEIIAQGEIIEFRITAYGFKQRSTHRYVIVTDSEIIEEQTDGPLRSWRHRHIYAAVDSLTCTLTDEIQFESPGGMMGFLLTEDKIIESLKDGMQARYESLARLLE